MKSEADQEITVAHARHRLEVLLQDTLHEQGRDLRRVTIIEHIALREVLDELHRANQVMNEQRDKIQQYAQKEFQRVNKSWAKKGSHSDGGLKRDIANKGKK
jgi:hypothetical protein